MERERVVEPGTVTVRGEATVPAKPDEVLVAIEVNVLEGTAEAALSEAALRSERLEAALTSLSIPEDRRATAGVTVKEEREYERNRFVSKGYRATNRILIRLDDAAPLGRLIREATEQAQARVDGPWWRVKLENPARVEACRQAATEARRKAEAYAGALGAKLGAVIAVTEPGLARPRPTGEMGQMRALAATAVVAAPPPEVEVHPGELDVSAAVEVTFALDQV